MLEGKKISELDQIDTLSLGSSFPVLDKGATKRIAFSALLNKIENELPESDIDKVKDDVEKLKVKTESINTLTAEMEAVKDQVSGVDEMVQGQNATIRNCVSAVEGLEQTIEQTHFDDVLALEEQVRANTTNIEKKLNKTTDSANAGKAVVVDENGNLVFGAAGGSALVPSITQEQYNNLTEAEKNNGQIREITNTNPKKVMLNGMDLLVILDDTITTASNVLSALKIKSMVDDVKTEIDAKHKYSTEEKVIGEWIDGKPIYRKVFIDPNNSWSAHNNIIGSITNFKEPTSIKAIAFNDIALSGWVENNEGGETRCYAYIKSNGEVHFYRYDITDGVDYPKKVIIEYTKTTD